MCSIHRTGFTDFLRGSLEVTEEVTVQATDSDDLENVNHSKEKAELRGGDRSGPYEGLFSVREGAR